VFNVGRKVLTHRIRVLIIDYSVQCGLTYLLFIYLFIYLFIIIIISIIVITYYYYFKIYVINFLPTEKKLHFR